MITIDQLKDVLEREDALRRYLDIDAKRVQIEEEEMRTHDPNFWEDQKAAEAQMKKVKDLKRWVEKYEAVHNAAQEVQLSFDFYKEELVTEADVDQAYEKAIALVEDLEMQNMLRAEEDKMSAVLKIVAGAGGTEAQDWAEMLFRMYQRWADRQGYKCEISNYQDGDEAGLKTATMKIEGDMAYGYLKSENGVHRLVRVSPYNAQGKRMTSFTSVFVVPLVDDSIEIEINPAGLSWDTFRSSGAGGQNVNKVESGVRLHYKFHNVLTDQDDEIVIENTETRDQPKNKENALRLLKSQLYDIELEKRRQETAKIEAGKKKIEWGSQIRSYVFDDRRVKDHRTDYQTSNVNAVMDGDIDGFIKAYLMQFGGGQ
ncbi:MAG: peptide chain release factor 2 [Bacteroidales bacterium]|nr:peptide chain release factor 2 [Bacteroidales bacterium]MBR6596923.1 peptide chain release factor 2 [Paludibacteraceae bacterium]MEE1062967.1 peptide chain release factor 2 [Paludibacteraceae bacterium]MEE1085371.1 peptide chain release factor 2 [Paludibacteraceae bacterium]